jgi:RNA polymerase sigma-70 factor (ECF subfamily)
MQSLPDPPRTPLYLALYEGYTAPEIAAMLSAPVNTIYSWINRGKKQLREALQ